MRLKRIFSMAWESMKQRKLRAFLTTLGVVIGITAIISLSSLGEGFRVTVTERMERGFELDVLIVRPGSLFGGGYGGFTDADVEAVKNVANISVATPVMQIGGVKLYNKEYRNLTVSVAAAVNFTEFAEIVFPDRFRPEDFEEGGMPEQIQNDTLIIGYKVNHPNETEIAFTHANDNVTLTIRTPQFPFGKNYSFTVAGTMRKTGAAGFTNFDYWIFIPLETARDIYGDFTDLDLIYVKVPDPEFSETVAEDIEDLFASRQVSVFVPLSFIQQVNSIVNIINTFLTSIASIALLVAGIGIMNIMTVSVMERTREIGILKAVGAKNRTILTMFLAEAALIGLLGSLIGVPTGYGISTLLSHLLSGFATAFQPEAERATVVPIVSWEWIVIAVIFGIAICILFGLYPARKAAKLDPVEALRYE